MRPTYEIREGDWAGWELRIARSGGVQWRCGAEAKWASAGLRSLASDYAVGEGPWPWLLEHGVTRPSPSGPSGPTQAEGERKAVQVPLRLPRLVRDRLDAIAAELGVTRSELVHRWVVREDAIRSLRERRLEKA